MRIAVLGGLGMQGRAAIADLGRRPAVTEIICVDRAPDGEAKLAGLVDRQKLRFFTPQDDGQTALEPALLDADAAIDLLPQPLMRNAMLAAIATSTPIVTTNYAKSIADLGPAAAQAGIGIMTECGLDPGIDLVLCARAAREFDQVEEIHSYCGGIPEQSACVAPLNYKVSWNFDMVLASQMRDAVMVDAGKAVIIPASIQHQNEFIHEIDFPSCGKLEAFPNGDAAHYVEMLGLSGVQKSGRYTLRWPGWSAFFHALKGLGFLSDAELNIADRGISPRAFVSKLLGPQLQYSRDEKDICVMRNVFIGVKDGRRKTMISDLLIERDLESGLFAMSLGVGYPASIVAQMLAAGEISKAGLLNPLIDIPDAPFLAALAQRGIIVEDRISLD